ncbi:hypothetical protein LV779_12470 [Streptomyces thinghirensis]|nr:hypothetical protein [Streptomyces thinghirensis]
MARRVYPVRLVGIGGPAHRLDLTLIDDNPQLDVCGVPARQLTPLVGRETYLVYHPVWAEIWLRTGMWSVPPCGSLCHGKSYSKSSTSSCMIPTASERSTSATASRSAPFRSP